MCGCPGIEYQHPISTTYLENTYDICQHFKGSLGYYNLTICSNSWQDMFVYGENWSNAPWSFENQTVKLRNIMEIAHKHLLEVLEGAGGENNL